MAILALPSLKASCDLAQVQAAVGALMAPYVAVALMATAAAFSAYLQSPPSLEPPGAVAAGPASVPVPFAHTAAVTATAPAAASPALRPRVVKPSTKPGTYPGRSPSKGGGPAAAKPRPPWPAGRPPSACLQGGRSASRVRSGRPGLQPWERVCRKGRQPASGGFRGLSSRSHRMLTGRGVRV